MAHQDADTATTPPKPRAPMPRRHRATRHIGLSLGADICWPQCYEQIMAILDPKIPWQGEDIHIEVERVTMEPYDLSQPCHYDVVWDRLSHWYPTTREWLKKAVIMDGVYAPNNPWSIQSMEKHSTYAAMMHLGMPVPKTWMIPPKAYDDPHPDLRHTLHHYAQLFDLGAVGEKIGYPLFMKPYDGGGWRGVSLIKNEQQLRRRYEESGSQVMHLQEAILPHQDFVRCLGIGPQTRLIRYDPQAPLHDRYTMAFDFVDDDEAQLLRDTTLTINSFFAFEFNSCEALKSDGIWYPIDFANACPDSQVTSLHFHFPWLVVANIKWSIYCAVTGRPMQRTPDWKPFYDIAAQKDMPYKDKLKAYAAIAKQRFETERFEDFCKTHLADLDEVAWEYFASAPARQAFRQKVQALYPPHEVEPFTELFWQRVQKWRHDNRPTAKTKTPETVTEA